MLLDFWFPFLPSSYVSGSQMENCLPPLKTLPLVPIIPYSFVHQGSPWGCVFCAFFLTFALKDNHTKNFPIAFTHRCQVLIFSVIFSVYYLLLFQYFMIKTHYVYFSKETSLLSRVTSPTCSLEL